MSRLLIWEEEGGAFIRDIGEWDPLPAHLAVPFRLAGRAAQVAFWGGGAPEDSMLHQLRGGGGRRDVNPGRVGERVARARRTSGGGAARRFRR